MKPELQKKLYKKYPKIFAQRKLPMSETCMCWGISCMDGWFWLIDNLCERIQSYIDGNKHLNITQVEAIQVKQKLGGLSFYIRGGDELIRGMIWLAAHLSYLICEACGSTNNVTRAKGLWIRMLCKKCKKKYRKE